jgi:uncharacterized protein (DUF3084 family)
VWEVRGAVTISTAEFNWQLILIIAAISVVVSYVGDVLGMRIGKRRISLFGLRPRYTSTVITMLTGLAVALLTLFVAAYTSESVRAAFFGVKYLEREISQLTLDLHDRQDQLDDMEFRLSMANSDLTTTQGQLLSVSGDLREAALKLSQTQSQAEGLEKERLRLSDQVDGLNAEKVQMEKAVASLRSETAQLKRGLAEMKEGRVIAFQGELLSQTPIEKGASSSEVDEALSRLVRTAEETLTLKNRESGMMNIANIPPKVIITDGEREKIHDAIQIAKDRKLLRLTAPSNIVLGQIVNGVAEIFDSKLVFRKDAVLLTDTVNGGMSQNDAADLLYTMLKQINPKAVALGVLPDPISGAVGNLDSLDFYEVVDRMSEPGKARSITFVAADDIYTEGPVNIKIILGDE